MEILISGASTGIGKACAVHLARLGHSVWAGVRTDKDALAVEKLNVQGLKPVLLDVTDDKSVNDCVHHVVKTAGTIQGLINNAGIAIGGPVEAVPMSEWRRQLDINFFGSVRLTQACLPRLREARGRIVNMSSLSGRMAFPFMGPYAASKYALEGMSDALRRELSPFGVHVALVEPGAIATPIWEKSRTEGLGALKQYSSEIRETYGKAMAYFARKIEDTAKNAAPVSHVTRAVEHALLSKRPRTRYPVGNHIHATTLMLNVIPDRWLDRVLR